MKARFTVCRIVITILVLITIVIIATFASKPSFLQPKFSFPTIENIVSDYETVEVIELVWKDRTIQIQQSEYVACLQDETFVFRNRQEYIDGVPLQLSKMFKECYPNCATDVPNKISNRLFIGLVRYYNHYYLAYRDNGYAMIEAIQGSSSPNISPLRWEDFCRMIYNFHTGPNKGVSGGNGLM